MRSKFPWAISVLILLFLASCRPANDEAEGPLKAEIRKTSGKYELYVNGRPFFIKGAGVERQPPGQGDIARLAAHGANSMRTWRTDEAGQSGTEILDEAHRHGLTVTMGLEIAREREGSGGVGIFGFNYDDTVAVRAQRERVREEVLKYKDHPALMIWGIGNELNLGATNPQVWDAVNEISEMIHEVDPNHLTTTMLAGISKPLVDDIKARAPDLDLLSVQMYADLPNLPRYIRESGWDGPYMVTEWGATGHWEVGKTPWGAPIENNSSEKADAYLSRFEAAIGSDTTQCIGSYVFLWGQKQERTPTWYGIFLQSGEETESVDVMHKIWNGEWPENRSPRVQSLLLNGKTAHDGVTLRKGRDYVAEAQIMDPDGDSVDFTWDIKPEATEVGEGGDFEPEPESIPGLITADGGPTVTVKTPDRPGAYRLFVYAMDGQGHAAHANVPFQVR